jgi:hypothetical protein
MLLLPAGTEVPQPPPANLCTIDHLDSRLSRQRGNHPGETRRVAACVACNARHNDYEQAALPREELWRRSGALPRHLRMA